MNTHAATAPDGAGRASLRTSPRATVVVPCFNGEEFVASAVERLLRQSAPARIVVVDDGSSDGSADVARALADVHDSVEAIVLPRNGGVAAAREAAVAAASGEFVWFIDIDDEWPDDALERMIGAADRYDADIVCAAAAVVAPGRATRMLQSSASPRVLAARAALAELLTGELTGHLWNKLFRRELVARVPFTRIAQHSDQAIVAQALAEATRVAVVPGTVYTYRLREGSIIRSNPRRAEALRVLGDVVGDAAGRVGLRGGVEHRYYEARYLHLSGFKDATSGAYPAADARVLLADVRSRMSAAHARSLLRKGDARRAALYTAGWAWPALLQRLLDRPGARL
ncbi:glycosyltransferase family 2 protein [Microbacterium sp. NPDC055683]